MTFVGWHEQSGEHLFMRASMRATFIFYHIDQNGMTTAQMESFCFSHIRAYHHITSHCTAIGNHGGAEDVINSNSNGVLLIFVWVLSFQHHPVCYGTIQILIYHLLSVCCLIHRISIAHRIHPILCSFAIAVLFMILLQQGLTVDYYLLYKKCSSLLNPIAVIHALSESLNI